MIRYCSGLKKNGSPEKRAEDSGTPYYKKKPSAAMQMALRNGIILIYHQVFKFNYFTVDTGTKHLVASS